MGVGSSSYQKQVDAFDDLLYLFAVLDEDYLQRVLEAAQKRLVRGAYTPLSVPSEMLRDGVEDLRAYALRLRREPPVSKKDARAAHDYITARLHRLMEIARLVSKLSAFEGHRRSRNHHHRHGRRHRKPSVFAPTCESSSPTVLR
ncbi:Hypothetical protein UVM_LOCUS76 [uncultured virus]|nr:Hypothetical protein UVM_LOCUS76 [uncultured virus]